ncbi:MAG: chemotaxis-specific protein-glutamate methyltransferase CheB [Alphaproteobacteria bacterium]|nr:chemotaxis-specific protein-glutamate methyltransferase CheB [Alphaproteobacteria bacterium]
MAAPTHPIRLIVVGDSGVVVGAVEAALKSSRDIEIAAVATDVTKAVVQLKTSPVDVVVLDIGMTGVSAERAIERIKGAAPDAHVILCLSLTFKNVKASMAALLSGAAMFIPVPGRHHKENNTVTFRRELLDALRGLTGRPVPERTPLPKVAPVIRLRTHAPTRPDVIAIGSSTGGPKALMTLFRAWPRGLQTPILVTQHLPAAFTAQLAQSIAAAADRPCIVGKTGEAIVPGRTYLAPGGFHMQVKKDGAAKVIRITDDPPENFCRPAVDPMFRSAAAAYGAKVLAVILTGMGRDGTVGGKAIVEAGGTVIAQDEATSVVWGMPGAAAEAGICSKILPLDDIAPAIAKLAAGGKAP